MTILDKMIQARRLTEFVREVLTIRNKEMIDQARWEFWLHKVFEMSFAEYLSTVEGTEEKEEVSSERLIEIVKDSMENIKAG